MSAGRALAWIAAAAVVGGGLYFLMTGKETAPEAAAPAAVIREIVPAAPMPAAEPSAEAVEPAEALGRDSAAAEEKIKQDQEREIRDMPAAPADMGMIDKDGIQKDAEDAARAAAKKP